MWAIFKMIFPEHLVMFTFVNLAHFLSLLYLLLLGFALKLTSFTFFTSQFLLWDTISVLSHSFYFASGVICICLFF